MLLSFFDYNVFVFRFFLFIVYDCLFTLFQFLYFYNLIFYLLSFLMCFAILLVFSVFVDPYAYFIRPLYSSRADPPENLIC